MTRVFETAAPATVADVFAGAMAERPDHEALVTRSSRLTYADLDETCARAATVLRDRGVGPGDRVAASLPNEADIVVAFHGAMRLGAIWVGINQALAPPEKAFLLEDSGTSLLLADDVAFDGPCVSGSELRSAIGTADPLRDLPSVDPHMPAAIAYTSGTTGRPKGAVHSQRNLLLPGRVLVETRGWDHTLRKGDCLPLTIVNLMVLTTLLTAQAQGTCVVMDQLFAAGVAEWIEREQVTVWNGPPALLHSLVADDDVDPAALASLTEVWSGGSDLPEALRARFDEKFGKPLIGTYGLSEAPTVVSIDPPGGDHTERASGRVLPHLAVTVADPDPSSADGIGELCLSAATDGPYAGEYTPLLGYWERPEASDEVLAGEVVHTGDIGFVDEDGWLHVRDRKNLVILRGGANVYPAEVERVLHGVDGVAGAAVVGIPDERLGERVVAAVEADPDADLDVDGLLERCRAELAKYKVPERIDIVGALPRNAMGKVDRTTIADRFR